MKTLKLFTIAMLSVFAFSCSDEDRKEFQDDLTDELEVVFLESDEIEDGLKIEGSELIKENPPQPSGGLTIDEGNANKASDTSAEFTFTTDQEVTGVYAQLTTRQGTTVPRYYDIPVSSLETSATDSGAGSKNLNTVSYTFNLDISDFEEVPVGTFCLSFCYYNTNGVSNVIVGCATIALNGEQKILETVEITTF